MSTRFFNKFLWLIVLCVVFANCSSSSHYKSAKSSKQTSGSNLNESPHGIWRPISKNSIPVTMNSRVKKWVKLFNGNLRPSFQRWLSRLGQYGPTIDTILRKENAPRDLIYLAMIESGLNMQAKSHASAVGPWQFISATGQRYGLYQNPFVEDRSDFIKATQAGARHLKDLYKMYGDWYLAFAAYNAGPGKVNRAIRKLKTKNYWKLSSRRSRYLRQETKDYVPKILAALHITKNYKRYGYSEKIFDPPLNFETVTVSGAVDYKAIAKASQSSVGLIQSLNPKLKLGITPPNAKTSILIPKGTRSSFQRRYSSMSPNERVSHLTYKTGPRETLSSIAKKYRVSSSELKKYNRYPKNKRLRTGTLVKIPAKSSVLKALASSSTTKSKSGSRHYYYRVKRGDSLSRIAKRNRTSIKKLAKWNKIRTTSTLRVGQKLKIYKKGRSSSSTRVAGFVSPYKKSRVSGVAHIILKDQQSSPSRSKAYAEVFESPASSSERPKIDKKQIRSMVAIAESDFGNFEDNEAPGQIKTYNRKAATKSRRGTSKFHTVRPGQTLSHIAGMYSLRVSQLKSYNRLSSDRIRVNQKLRLSPKKTVIIHRVRSGETLWSLSRKYKVKIQDIKKWNKLASDTVRPNQKIKIMGQS